MSSIEYINSVVLTTSAANVIFSNIPQYYQDLILLCQLRADQSTFNNTNYPHLRLNNDTGTNYSYTRLYARSTAGSWSAESIRATNTSDNAMVGITMNNSNSNIFTPAIYYIMSYANTSINKTILAEAAQASNLTNEDGPIASVALWRNTNAITNILLRPSQDPSNFVIGSTFTLWGVK